MYTKFADSMIW